MPIHSALLFAALRPDMWPHTANLPDEEQRWLESARHFLAEAVIPVLDG